MVSRSLAIPLKMVMGASCTFIFLTRVCEGRTWNLKIKRLGAASI